MSTIGVDDDSLSIDFDQFIKCSTPPGDALGPSLESGGSGTAADEAFDESDSYDVQDLLEEAYKHYGDVKPPFCIANKGEKTRSVRLTGSGIEHLLTFRTWPGERWGFWVFTDQIGDQYICKFDKGYYHVWQGISGGFSEQPMAKATSVQGGHENIPIEESGSPGGRHSPARALRKRTARQQQPYSMCRIQRKHESRGIHATETQLEQSLAGVQKDHERSRHETKVEGNTIRRETSSLTPYRGHSVLPDSQECKTLRHAFLRSRVDSFTGPSVPICLAKIQTIQELFAGLRLRWGAWLGHKSIRYCVVQFSWLDNDRSLYLHADDEDAWQLLCEEFLQSGEWQTDARVTADLSICTEQEE